MSANKQTRAYNRFQDYRATRNQLAIWKLYNDETFMVQQKVPGFRKRKAMNCGCRTCRGWAQDAKRFRLSLQLEKQGMKEKHSKSFWDERPDIATREEYEGLVTNEEEWV